MLQVLSFLQFKGEQTSILFIMDLSGLQYNAQLLEILQGSFPALVTFASEHYEEIIQCFLIVNAPLLSNFLQNDRKFFTMSQNGKITHF